MQVWAQFDSYQTRGETQAHMCSQRHSPRLYQLMTMNSKDPLLLLQWPMICSHLKDTACQFGAESNFPSKIQGHLRLISGNRWYGLLYSHHAIAPINEKFQSTSRNNLHQARRRYPFCHPDSRRCHPMQSCKQGCSRGLPQRTLCSKSRSLSLCHRPILCL